MAENVKNEQGQIVVPVGMVNETSGVPSTVPDVPEDEATTDQEED